MERVPQTGEREWTGRLAQTPFAAALAKRAALIVAHGEPPQVVFATPAAFSAFGVSDAFALAAVVFGGDSLSARRLRRFGEDMPLEAPPRLETLRYFVAREPVSVAWLCGRIQRDGETYFVAADPKGWTDEVDPAPDAPSRFVWRLDGEARFGPPDAALIGQFGENAPRAGETLAGFGERVGLGLAWMARVAARETFSRLSVTWPEPGGARGRTVALSGAPAFGAGRVYEGFAGFGVVGSESVAMPAPSAAAPSGSSPLAGDAAALIGLLQRQHAPQLSSGPLSSPPGAVSAPALAVISALAALLQLKPVRAEPKPAPVSRPAPPEPKPTSGAEIVRLRPHVSPAAADAAPRESDSVALTSQERDAFKEIARALGANVRAGRNVPLGSDAPAEAPPPETAAPVLSASSDAGEGMSVDSDFAALFDILPVAVLVTRGEAPLYANRTLLDLVGYADFADFRARDGMKAIFKGRDPRSLTTGGVSSLALAATDERVTHVDALMRPAVWQGAAAELIAMRRSRDAEHQEELRAVEREAALHAARARDLAAALDAARDGMVRLDRNGRILGMNPGAETLLGYDQTKAAGESFLTLLAASSHGDASAALERLTRGDVGPPESLDLVARSQDGRELDLRVELGRLANRPQPDFFVLLSRRGPTETAPESAKASAEAAEQLSSAKTELLSRVSHEIRTPLTSILGFAEVILQERFGPIGNARYRDYVRDIHATGQHVLSLANDLLDLTKLDLGKVELQFAPVDVNAVVRDCIALMQPQAARERVIVRLSLYERLPKIMADERSLRQILLNLINNAVKFNEPGGQVIVSTAIDEDAHVLLRVRDTGVGMSESELAIALEPYRRLENAKETKGAGLGLPIAKALVEANHADFSIKSRRDQGTLVEIAFTPPQAAQ